MLVKSVKSKPKCKKVYGSWKDGSDICKGENRYYIIQWNPKTEKSYKKYLPTSWKPKVNKTKTKKRYF